MLVFLLLISNVIFLFLYLGLHSQYKDKCFSYNSLQAELNSLLKKTKITEILQIIVDNHSNILAKKELDRLWEIWPIYPPDWNIRKSQVAYRDKYTCQKCGEVHAHGHVHHVKPLSQGGTNELVNLQYLCLKCHEDLHGFKITSSASYYKKRTYQEKLRDLNEFDNTPEIVDPNDCMWNDSNY